MPAGIHVVMNGTIFFMTAIHCNRIKNDIHQMQAVDQDSNASAKSRKFIATKAM